MLDTTASGNRQVYLAPGSYAITVGAGGAAQGPGNSSSLANIIVANGGGQGWGQVTGISTGGGSGGGGYATGLSGFGRGTAGQGNNGGSYATNTAGSTAGGGGAGGVGGSQNAGIAGPGLASTITGTSVIYAVGGAGYVGGVVTPGTGSGNPGSGANAENLAGTAGIVVIRYPI